MKVEYAQKPEENVIDWLSRLHEMARKQAEEGGVSKIDLELLTIIFNNTEFLIRECRQHFQK